MQTFAITRHLVDIATGLGIDLDIAFRLAKNFTYVSDHRSLNTHQFRLLQDGYNAHRQTKSQSFTDQLKKWRSENALIRKYEMNTCPPDEIKRAEDLIAKRANHKRNRTDAMLETEEPKEEKRLKAEAERLEKAKALTERVAFNRAERAEKQAAKLAADKLEMENNLAERASSKRDEEMERVAAAKEAADKLAAGTNCTERA